jgi:hypothetical protein
MPEKTTRSGVGEAWLAQRVGVTLYPTVVIILLPRTPSFEDSTEGNIPIINRISVIRKYFSHVTRHAAPSSFPITYGYRKYRILGGIKHFGGKRSRANLVLNRTHGGGVDGAAETWYNHGTVTTPSPSLGGHRCWQHVSPLFWIY